MTKAAFERKETREKLRQMAEKGAKGESESYYDGEGDGYQFDDGERRWNDSSFRVVLREADLEEIDEKRWRHADEQMLEVEQRSEEKRRFDVAPLKDARESEQQNAEEKAVVLEMHVIDEEEAKIGEEQEDDDHLRVLERGNAFESRGRGSVSAGAG